MSVLLSVFDYIDPFFFLISLFLGLAYTYLLAKPMRMVVKYPTPFNIKDTVYVDENNVCYKYKIKEVACPYNKSDITYILPSNNS